MPQLFYEGVHRRILWVEPASGRTRAKAYFERLAPRERARVHALLKRMVTNGYDKPSEKVRRQEVERARRIRANYEAEKGTSGRG